MIRVIELKTAKADVVAEIKRRAQADIDEVRGAVMEIIAAVRRDGDDALVHYTRQWDDDAFSKSKLRVTEADFDEAYRETPKNTVEKIKDQIQLSKRFHELQRKHIVDWQEETEPGILVGEKWTPMDRVGLYVPGGKNPFPTVQQILAVPAKIAGCPSIVSCVSPRGKNYEVLIAARESGIEELFRVSGPHAVAAMAYGTESIRPVELVAGPGNPFVTAAKILCQDRIAIDMPAGPSEAIILADTSLLGAGMTMQRLAKFCAADVLARAEHGPDSAGVLVTESAELAAMVKQEIERQTTTLTRQHYIHEALERYSAIVVTESLAESIAFTNEYAPEHLELLSPTPENILAKIVNAGSVFLGYFNPVAVGDYATGVNHILPTGTWARRSSAVAVWTFMKRVQYSSLTEAGLKRLQPIVQTIADVEGLDAHRRSVDIRFE